MSLTAHESLKSATTAAHHSIEKVMGPYFMQPSKENYREMIQNYAAFYENLENRFRHFSDLNDELQLDQRLQKSAWLKDDLSKLEDQQPKMGTDVPIKIDDQKLRLKSKAEFLGALYVIEGSTLGGQILLKRFKETLGVSESEGGKFFSGYGPETGVMWRRFLSVLNEELQTPEEIQAAVDSAKNTFQLMEDCMK